MIEHTQVAKTYTKALETINARKATANLHRLYINFAKFYEEGGVLAQPGKQSRTSTAHGRYWKRAPK
jgi:hypothetical protein